MTKLHENKYESKYGKQGNTRKYETINDRVLAKVIFTEVGHPIIHSFNWDGRSIDVDSLEVVNQAYRGNELIYFFSVGTPKGAYKLRFETKTLTWWLEQVYWEELC